MADIAFIFHWSPEHMDRMDPEELARWWAHAEARWKATQPPSAGPNV
ncbi:GpE family phage tail protein [Roseinatronobacter sp. NSM]